MDQLLTVNGRKIGIHEYGRKTGLPVFYFHGFPGSRLDGHTLDFEEQTKHQKFRVIAVDRPGIGLSDSLQQRTLLDWGCDVAMIADKLGIRTFSVIGFSGGGPYALASAFSIPDRIRSVGVISSMGPFAYKESRNDNAMLFPKLPPVVRQAITYALYKAFKGNPDAFAIILKQVLADADREYLSRKDHLHNLALTMSEHFRQGINGFLKEAEIYKHPWGFKLPEIHTPVHLWQGTTDRNVGITSGKRLAEEIPNCKANFIEGEGHFSLPGKYFDKMLYDLGSGQDPA